MNHFVGVPFNIDTVVLEGTTGKAITGLIVTFKILTKEFSLVMTGTMLENGGVYYYPVTLTSPGEYYIYYTTPNGYEDGYEDIYVDSYSNYELIGGQAL